MKVLTMNPVDDLKSKYVPKIFVVCDRTDTAPVWGFILRQQGLTVILETSLDKALDRWSLEMPDLVVIDGDNGNQWFRHGYRFLFVDRNVGPGTPAPTSGI